MFFKHRRLSGLSNGFLFLQKFSWLSGTSLIWGTLMLLVSQCLANVPPPMLSHLPCIMNMIFPETNFFGGGLWCCNEWRKFGLFRPTSATDFFRRFLRQIYVNGRRRREEKKGKNFNYGRASAHTWGLTL